MVAGNSDQQSGYDAVQSFYSQSSPQYELQPVINQLWLDQNYSIEISDEYAYNIQIGSDKDEYGH